MYFLYVNTHCVFQNFVFQNVCIRTHIAIAIRKRHLRYLIPGFNLVLYVPYYVREESRYSGVYYTQESISMSNCLTSYEIQATHLQYFQYLHPSGGVLSASTYYCFYYCFRLSRYVPVRTSYMYVLSFHIIYTYS